MRIHNFMPYSPDKDLVGEYNYYMSLIGDEDWACFIDHDAMWTTYDWYNQILEYIKKYPECGCFGVMTNRCGGRHQKAFINDYGDDYALQRKAGESMEVDLFEIEDVTKPDPFHFSAVNFVLSKRVWNKIGGFKQWSDSKILGIDSKLHQDIYEAGEKLYIMKGVYVYHWYRGGGKDKSHLL